MPTISELPVAGTIDADDAIPISQGGFARAVAVGTLFAQTQPAINVPTSSLLGRTSLGPGGPEAVEIGIGLALNLGTLAATGSDHALFSAEGTLELSDEFVVNSSGTPKLVQASLLRSLFSPGSNIAIDPSGVISATLESGGINSSGEPYRIGELPSAPTIAAQDLLAISQGGVDHSIGYATLLNGQTIDEAQAAQEAANTDTFWVAQGSSMMVRQSFAGLWSWIADNVSSLALRTVELNSNTAITASAHNGRVLICSQPVVLSVAAQTLVNGFWCELVNVSSGVVTLSGQIMSSSGSATLPAGQAGALRCLSYSGGTIIYALLNEPGTGLVLPGAATGLATTSIGPSSIAVSWQAPTAGGAASAYTVQYRVSGTTPWIQAAQAQTATNFAATGLTPNTSYDFSVLSMNASGVGPSSNILTVTTSLTLAPPGQVTGVGVSVSSSTAVTVSWSAPSSGGPVSSYTVQYRTSGSTAWSASVSGLSGTSESITTLSPATNYDFAVLATNQAGSGPLSSIVGGTTAQPSAAVTSITWNVLPSGSYSRGTGSVGVNAHASPVTAAIQFGLSTSTAVLPSTWTAGTWVNTDLWGAYVSVPSTPGTWYIWAEGTDGSCPTVSQTGIIVT